MLEVNNESLCDRVNILMPQHPGKQLPKTAETAGTGLLL
jgi:hypothetical protein